MPPELKALQNKKKREEEEKKKQELEKEKKEKEEETLSVQSAPPAKTKLITIGVNKTPKIELKFTNVTSLGSTISQEDTESTADTSTSKPEEKKEQELSRSEPPKKKLALSINLTTKLNTKPEEAEEPKKASSKPSKSSSKSNRSSRSSSHRGDRDRDSSRDKKSDIPKEEAKSTFLNLMKEKNVSITWKWKQVHNALKDDPRYRVIPRVSEKKKLFSEYVMLTKRAERNMVRNKIEQARNEFKAMLMDFENLTSDSKWSYCVQFFYMDQRYQAVEEKERETLFQDYLDELYEKERKEEKKKREGLIERMKEHFKELPIITTGTKWEEACDLLKYNAVWQKMCLFDRLEAFSEYILTKQKEEDDARKKKQKRRERINRLAYREMLAEAVIGDRLTFKTKWRDFVKENKDDVRLFYMFKQHGSAPREIFEDVRDELRELQKKVKEDFKEILKNNSARFHGEMDVETFSKILGEYPAFKDFEKKKSNTLRFFANYLLDKLRKRVKKAEQKFLKICVKEITSPEVSFEVLSSKIKENEANAVYLSCLSAQEQLKLYNSVRDKMQKGENPAELLVTKKKKKKKKDKEKDKEKDRGKPRKRDRTRRSRSRTRSQGKKDKDKDIKLGKRLREESQEKSNRRGHRQDSKRDKTQRNSGKHQEEGSRKEERDVKSRDQEKNDNKEGDVEPKTVKKLKIEKSEDVDKKTQNVPQAELKANLESKDASKEPESKMQEEVENEKEEGKEAPLEAQEDKKKDEKESKEVKEAEDSDLEQGEVRAPPRHARKRGKRRRRKFSDSSSGSSSEDLSASPRRRRRRRGR